MKDTILSILRHVLTAAGAALVAKGYVSDTGLTEVVGATVGLIGALWGPIDEYLHAKKVAAANK